MTLRCLVEASGAGRGWLWGLRPAPSVTSVTSLSSRILHHTCTAGCSTFTRHPHKFARSLVSITTDNRRFCATQAPASDEKKRKDSASSQMNKVLKEVMRQVPQAVVVVTTAKYNSKTATWIKRGMTCSSFTSVSLQPPVVSVAVKRPSRMHDLLLQVERFAIHVLGQNQVKHAIHFAKPPTEGTDQFEAISHEQDSHGIPILQGASAVLHCRYHSITTIGDHHVWFGEVMQGHADQAVKEPLLYYSRSFRSLGDETFIQAFENTTLPFEEWTHEAHLRMAWNYIREYGQDKATPIIRAGIKKYNEQNKEKIQRGYHETVTMFYIHSVAAAIREFNAADLEFEEFIERNHHLTEKNLLFKYYSEKIISQPEATQQFIPPDLQALP